MKKEDRESFAMLAKFMAGLLAVIVVAVIVVPDLVSGWRSSSGSGGMPLIRIEDDMDSADDNESARRASCLALAEYGDILDPSYRGEPLAPSVIMDDYTSGHQKYVNQYYTIEDGCILATAYLGDSHIRSRYYYPGTVRDDYWTADSLVASYDNQWLPWTEGDTPWHHYLYSSDYRNCFEVYDGWLWIDDVKVCPVGNYAVSTTNPENILYIYQQGQWNAQIPVFSTDYSTKVTVDKWCGTLTYEYESINYYDDYDVLQLGCRPFLNPPECLVTDVSEKYEVRSYLDLDISRSGYAKEVHEAEVKVYIDLPNGSLDAFEDRLYHQYAGPEVGMYIVMPDRVELYRCGALVNTWACDVTTKTPKIRQYVNDSNFGTEAHVWVSDDKIVRLLPNGKTETVLGGLTGDIYGIGEYALLELSLVDGKLTGYSDICGIVEIADNVESVDYAWNVALFTGDDGLRYMFGEDDYIKTERVARAARESGESFEGVIEVHCLGERSWEDYLDAYRAGLIYQFMEGEYLQTM